MSLMTYAGGEGCLLTSKIFGHPKAPGAIFHVDTDAGNREIGAEDILAMPVIRGLLGHHSIEEPHRFLQIGSLARLTNIFPVPGKRDPYGSHP